MIALDHEGNKLIIRERIGGDWYMYLFAIVCVGAIADELAKRTFGNLTIPIGAIASLLCGVFVFYRLQRRSVIIDQDDRTIVFKQGNILTSKSRLYFFDDLISPFKVISAPRPLNRGGPTASGYSFVKIIQRGERAESTVIHGLGIAVDAILGDPSAR